MTHYSFADMVLLVELVRERTTLIKCKETQTDMEMAGKKKQE